MGSGSRDMKIYFITFVKTVIAFLLMVGGYWTPVQGQPLDPDQPIRGWNILSDDLKGGLETVQRAAEYGINHLQISHQTIMDLRQVRDPERFKVAEKLTEAAHEAGIQEVAFWDHALYPLDYYPDRFKTGPGGTLNLDNPEFWTWFKQDYRDMLEKAPDIQALILTFIETGARVEDQHSEQLTTDAQKLAAVVNAVADVVIREYGMNLYARTFAYDDEEYEWITSAIDLFEHEEIRLMMKEAPHDFLMPHPTSPLPGKIALKTIIEFDVTGEYNGQGLVLNTFPEHFLDRWSVFLKRDHIGGYVARMDRYGDTHIVNTPTEINAFALDRYSRDQSTLASDVYQEFIKQRYSAQAYPMLREAFQNARDITLSTFYTLNTSTANHSRLNYDPYSSSYARHVSGSWMERPMTYVPRGVNKEFHYWKDIINTIAPDWAKKGGTQLDERPRVTEQGWLDKQERMNSQYLRYILAEKDYGIALAKENLEHLEAAKPYLTKEDYTWLKHHFNHTLLTVQLHREVAAAYWAFRIYARGAEYQTPYVENTLDQALDRMLEVAEKIENYPVKPASGQWNWVGDAEMARTYHRWITEEGWPDKTAGYSVSFGGKIYN